MAFSDRTTTDSRLMSFPESGDHWGNVIPLWPSRFLSADAESRQVTVRTTDGTVRVYPNRPWID